MAKRRATRTATRSKGNELIESLFGGESSRIQIGVGQEVAHSSSELQLEVAAPSQLEGKGKNKNAGLVLRRPGTNPNLSYHHQTEAMECLDKRFNNSGSRSRGLVVIPTGGGKTRIAVDWLLRQVLDKNRKILWIAHREELLIQAWNAFCENAFANLLPSRDKFHIRRISGQGDQANRIKPNDDVVIASVQSLRGEALDGIGLQEWLKGKNRPFLVIDEAHHSPARSYRQIMEKVCEKGNADLLGLTATPFRTLESERGAIARIFGEIPIYSVSLKRLIDDRILARPVFISTKTDFSFQEALPAEEWKKLESQQFNLEMLDEKWARQIGENASRNKKIVDHYCEDRKKYGPTLVFALNVANAIALNKLFNDRKVRAAVVVGDLRDQTGTHNVSHKKRTEDLERFKNGDLDVLVNVNVFTEGTDLPKVQTVFLTRPTTSKTLVMQMVGRALRGERARGTKDAYIVSFIDDWEDKIEWANPEQLFVDGDTDARERMPETRQQPSHLISIEFLEKLAALFDASLPANSHLQKHSFLERVPIGLYSFSLLDSETGTDRDRTVLVYSGNHREFTEFTNDLPTLLKPYSSGKKVSLSATELDELMNNVRERYFGSADRFPPVSDAELHDMIQFAFVYEAVPELIVFAERDKLDIDAVAKVLFEQELGGQRKMDYLHQVWRDNSAGWQNFFGIGGFEQFVREVNYANTRLETQAAPRGASPNVVPETIDIEEMSLEAIKEQFPQKYLDLRSQVEKTHRSDNGAFVCAKCGRESRVRYSFEIDHRKPRSKRGLTRLDNLQLLCVKCNRRKGAKF